MKKLVKFKTAQPIAFCVIAGVVSLCSLLLASIFLDLILTNIPNLSQNAPLLFDDYILTFIAETLTAIIMITFAYKTATQSALFQRMSSIGHAFQVAAYPTTLIAFIAIAMIAESITMGYALNPAINIFFYILAMLSIGFLEEFVFRGIIAKTLLLHYGTSTKGTWIAAIISGVIFGFAHIINAIGLPLFGVLVQITVAIVLGILFAAIYYRTGNLWICVLLHAGINAASLLQGGFYNVGNMQELISSYTLLNLLPCVTYFIPVPFLLRKSKNFEVGYWFDEHL